MHYLVTGHTGFKGAWLTLLLVERGHKVSGVSLQPQSNSLFISAGISKFLEREITCDIRDLEKLEEALSETNPDVIIHMAAQSLVRESYADPITTFKN
jgi:CDP-glucose 4,6-dehydratase